MSKKRVFVLNHTGDRVVVGWSDPMKAGSFQLITAAGGEPSGFAVMKDGGCRVGQELYSIDFPSIKKIYLDVNNLSDIPDNLQVSYARAWLEKIKNYNFELFEDCEEFWVIGCPSSNNNTISQYQVSFEAAGYKNVHVIPIDDCLKHSFQKCLDITDESSDILYIDLGAHRSRAIYITDGVMRSVDGCIGTSLIEKMILFKNLIGNFNPPEISQAIFQKCINDSNVVNYLLLYVRKLLKNCSVEHNAQKIQVFNIDKTLGVQDSGLILTIDAEMLWSVLEDDKISSVLPTDFNFFSEDEKKYISTETWLDYLKSFLKETAEKVPEFVNATSNGKRKKKIICAGDVFANSNIETIKETAYYFLPIDEYEPRSIAPVASITKCLSRLGENMLKGKKILEHLNFISSHDADGNKTGWQNSELYGVIKKVHTDFYEELIQLISNEMLQSLQRYIDMWEEGYDEDGHRFPPEEIAGTAYLSFEYFLNKEFKHIEIPRKLKYAKNSLIAEFNKLYQPVLKRLNISTALLVQENLHWDNAVDDIYSFFGDSEKYYESLHGFYEKLPDDGSIIKVDNKKVREWHFTQYEKLERALGIVRPPKNIAAFYVTNADLKEHNKIWIHEIKSIATDFLFNQANQEQAINNCFNDIKKAIEEKAKSFGN